MNTKHPLSWSVLPPLLTILFAQDQWAVVQPEVLAEEGMHSFGEGLFTAHGIHP